MQALLSIFRTTDHILSLSLADLTEEQARHRSRGDAGPSITWTVGHMLNQRHQVLAFLGDQPESPWEASFGDVAATDGAGYPTLATMRAEWQQMHDEIERAFASLTPEMLDRPADSRGVHGESSIRDKVSFIAWHEGYHVGVIGAIRTAAGLPGPADLARAASPARTS
ncbi:MAG: DinB family protein [Gemmatimonadota bacterium]